MSFSVGFNLSFLECSGILPLIEAAFQRYEIWTTNSIFIEIITIFKLLLSRFSKKKSIIWQKNE